MGGKAGEATRKSKGRPLSLANSRPERGTKRPPRQQYYSTNSIVVQLMATHQTDQRDPMHTLEQATGNWPTLLFDGTIVHEPALLG